MKKITGIILACMMVFPAAMQADFISTAQSVVTSDSMIVNVEFLSSDIVHVTKYYTAPEKKSYSVIMKKQKTEQASLQVDVDKQGIVTFKDLQGNVLLQEIDNPVMIPCRNKADAGKYEIGQAWRMNAGEQIFGLGQLRDKTMTWNNREVELWNHNTYIAIPYFTTDKGYGLYWDNAGRSWFKSDEKDDNKIVFTSEVGTCIDYYFMYKDGTQDGVIAAIRQLTGQATMFPLWTMGHWQCRERYKTSDELAGVLDKYRELEIPLDGIVQDWQYWGCDSNWNAMRFMNPYYINKVGDKEWAKYLPEDMRKLTPKEPRLKSPDEMVKYVHQNNAHLMISIWANFGSWTEPYKKLEEIGALLPFDTWPRNKGVFPYDPFNPKARDIYWQYLSHLYQMGFDAWWTDSSEPDHFEKEGDAWQMTHDGTWHSVKNAFPLVHNKGIYEHQRAMKGNTKRSVQMTRSGAFGIQHYGTFSWSGDINASWDEMKKQVPSGLNFTLCGIPFWNTDLGGFFYWDYNNDPKNPALQELHTRWMQWGTFMPLMRNHCSSPMVSELYEFGQKGDWAYDAMVDAIRLRYRLLPYIYSTAGDVVQHSGSMMRPLVMDFPKDRQAITLNDEYLFGRNFLVKPVTDPLYTWKDERKNGHEIYPDIRQAKAPVKVYLPEGAHWYDFFTGQKYDGGRTILRPTPISDMPVFVREGSIVPFGPAVQYSNEKTWDDLEICIYPGADGHFVLYEDEGDTYNYERGQFTEIPFTWNESTRTLIIGARKGKFKGMLKQRQFRVHCVSGDIQTISYDGKEITITIQ